MGDPETVDRQEGGFEYDGIFYHSSFTDLAKDIMLVAQFLPPQKFFESIEDQEAERPFEAILALIATSIRNAHPDWTVERIVAFVQNISMSNVEWINLGEEEQPVPPAEAGEPQPATSGEPSNGSSSASTPEETSTPTDATSSETPRSSSSHGSRTGSPEPAAPKT